MRRDERRVRLENARIQLLFTPHLCEPRDPLEVLAAALPYVDAIQVRPKRADPSPGSSGAPPPPTRSVARDVFDWCIRVIDLVRSTRVDALVLVNDRVDVAMSLLDAGVDGVHLGQDDLAVELARELLGPDALIGLSTHTQTQVALAQELDLDYLGFGPIHATATKGYVRGLGSEAAWVAQRGSQIPLFPIGGISVENVGELTNIGRAAVSSTILRADDPARAARILRSLLAAD